VSVASDIQHEMSMRIIILPSMACLLLPYFSTLSHKWHNVQEGKVRNSKLFFVLLFILICFAILICFDIYSYLFYLFLLVLLFILICFAISSYLFFLFRHSYLL